MPLLPLVPTSDQSTQLLQTRWKSVLDPVLKTTLVNGLLLEGVSLAIGNTVINHRLGRKQIGWLITDTDTPAIIYRAAALNDITLTLNSDTQVTISLWVF